ncbi:hypothetical protein I4U23_008185 [Adineta vaga]|nr:hypothetical protein I4U23_008185 [Adineta vaga]
MAWLNTKHNLPFDPTNSFKNTKMSHPCDIPNCGRISRALCHCCNQNLCRDHLNEHDDILNNQLNPFADEINLLNDQLNHINVNMIVENDYKQLKYWREYFHQLVEEYFDRKQRELEEYMSRKLHRQFEQINQLRILLNELAQKQNTTIQDLQSISSTIHSLRKEITDLDQKSFKLIVNPIEIDEKLIQIEEECKKVDFDLSTLGPPLHTINRTTESAKAMATNNRVVLIHHDNRICLLNKEMIITQCTFWPHGWIWDMCWSSTLSRFIIITLNDIFILDETNMLVERVITKENLFLSACTCSETALYITTNEIASSVYEFSLRPTIEIINRWQPADLCQANETIQDIIFHRGTFGFIIENQVDCTKRMELRSMETFEQLWTVRFDFVDPLHNPYRLCLFNCDEWIVIDWKSSQLLYITKDGQMKSTCVYDEIPYRCCQFGSNLLAISTRNGVNFHKM